MVPCTLRTEIWKQALAEVLSQIKKRFPGDHARIVARVLCVCPESENPNHTEGTVGEWRVDWSRDQLGVDEEELPGQVYIDDSIPKHELIAAIAHEFGHVCLTSDDCDARGPIPFSEFAEELTADWYAHRWGFGGHIEQIRDGRKLAHHGFGPCQEGEINGRRCRVDADFVFHWLD